MKTKAEKIEWLWRYAENDCSVPEQRQIEAWLANDPELRQEWLSIQELNKQLSEHISAEEPSLRFKANVMERLPEPSESLVSKKLKIGLVSAFVFLTVLGTLGTEGLAQIPYLSKFWSLDWEPSLLSWGEYLFDLQVGSYWVIFLAILIPLLLDEYLVKLLLKQRDKLQRKKN